MAVQSGALVKPRARSRPNEARRILREMRKQWTAYLFLLPGLILFLIFTVFSATYAFYLSFHQWNILEPAKPYVGLDNYRRLWDDHRFRDSIVNTIYYTATTVPLSVIIGLLIALLLNHEIRARGLFRTLFYIPVITPLVIAAIIWKWVYQGDYGLLNYYLLKLHIIHEPLLWLADKRLAMPAVVGMWVWKTVGFVMVVYLAGLQAIPQDYYDAAKVDGAGSVRQFRDITIPLLSNTTYFVVVIEFLVSFQAFTQIFVMTSGGPVGRTTTVVYYIYTYAFKRFDMGYASAMAFALFAMMFGFALIQMRFFYKEHEY
ncbi:MAG: carbohydrate ABC transporter permease [Thermomicrobiales bacterium]